MLLCSHQHVGGPGEGVSGDVSFHQCSDIVSLTHYTQKIKFIQYTLTADGEKKIFSNFIRQLRSTIMSADM